MIRQDAQHAVWERRQTEIWDRIFQVTRDVVVLAGALNDSAGRHVLRDELLKSAMGVGLALVRANAADSAPVFKRYVHEARLKAIETDYWLRLVYVLQERDDVQRDLSSIITQYASVISLLQRLFRHTRSEANVLRRHTKGPTVSS
jgi:four helix bundle protein